MSKMTDDAWNELVLLEMRYGEDVLYEMITQWYKYLKESKEDE